jgi:hypothetical protein
VVKKREKLDLSYFYKHQANLKKEIKEYLCRFKNKKVAIWGAGHQALAVLSLIDAQKSPSFSSGMNAPKIIPTRSSKLSKKILTYKAESGVSMKPRALARGGSLNLSGKIRYVIDSATFKQGKYTPVTHIPIVSPGALAKNPPDAVIIMAGSYSDEVARVIPKYGKKINVSILRDFGLEII